MGTTLPLAYEDTNVFLSIEMAELTPVNSGYGEFTIAPALPVGLSFDAQNGWISGTPTQLSAETTYTVNAKSAAGVATSTTRPETIFGDVAVAVNSHDSHHMVVFSTSVDPAVPAGTGANPPHRSSVAPPR